MPYLRLDVNGRHAVHSKRRLVQRLCETYARFTEVDLHRISVAIRENGEGGIWRMVNGEPMPVSVLMCDIQNGQPEQLLMRLARALCDDCMEILGSRVERLHVEFTQQSGDEMYHPSINGYEARLSEEEFVAGAVVRQ